MNSAMYDAPIIIEHDVTEAYSAPHKEGEADNAYFITNASEVYKITTIDNGRLCVIPATATLELGYLEPEV